MSKDKIINGKYLSQTFTQKVKENLREMDQKPSLAIVLLGDDPSSHLYVKLKDRACDDCDIDFHKYLFEDNSNTNDVIATIDFLNKDPEVDGILVQLPLPEQYDTDKIISAIDYRKDIDGFHPTNREKMTKCEYTMLPPLPAGIIEMVKATDEEIKNKRVTILCNHKIFGDPFKCEWGKDNDVQVVTTEDEGWKTFVAAADVLVVSVGLPFFITKDMIKEDCIIIDVGINKLDDGEVVGDVNIADVAKKVKFISPVPGGVGPMTIAMLLTNLVKLKQTKSS
jgi:methylenetetrahydrofolate dehydrogenase (NADP+) / methenyltetrahydrofolate cyclohydrolase